MTGLLLSESWLGHGLVKHHVCPIQVHPGRGFPPDFLPGLFQKGQKAGALSFDLGRRTRVVEGDYRRQNALTRALQEYGRLVKPIFILRYLESEQIRRRIDTQLNKGESLHSGQRDLNRVGARPLALQFPRRSLRTGSLFARVGPTHEWH